MLRWRWSAPRLEKAASCSQFVSYDDMCVLRVLGNQYLIGYIGGLCFYCLKQRQGKLRLGSDLSSKNLESCGAFLSMYTVNAAPSVDTTGYDLGIACVCCVLTANA
jgi:hypothetical protein